MSASDIVDIVGGPTCDHGPLSGSCDRNHDSTPRPNPDRTRAWDALAIGVPLGATNFGVDARLDDDRRTDRSWADSDAAHSRHTSRGGSDAPTLDPRVPCTGGRIPEPSGDVSETLARIWILDDDTTNVLWRWPRRGAKGDPEIDGWAAADERPAQAGYGSGTNAGLRTKTNREVVHAARCWVVRIDRSDVSGSHNRSNLRAGKLRDERSEVEHLDRSASADEGLTSPGEIGQSSEPDCFLAGGLCAIVCTGGASKRSSARGMPFGVGFGLSRQPLQFDRLLIQLNRPPVQLRDAILEITHDVLSSIHLRHDRLERQLRIATTALVATGRVRFGRIACFGKFASSPGGDLLGLSQVGVSSLEELRDTRKLWTRLFDRVDARLSSLDLAGHDLQVAESRVASTRILA